MISPYDAFMFFMIEEKIIYYFPQVNFYVADIGNTIHSSVFRSQTKTSSEGSYLPLMKISKYTTSFLQDSKIYNYCCRISNQILSFLLHHHLMMLENSFIRTPKFKDVPFFLAMLNAFSFFFPFSKF